MWNDRWLQNGYYNQPNWSWVAAAIGGSAAVGAAVNIWSTKKASDAQTSAADKAGAIALQQYYQSRQDLAPYRESGYAAQSELNKRLSFLTSPIVMDQEALEKTPGYQFTRWQGLKAVQNSATARGLGVSGAALKGASEFATGLANKTYKDQFELENINRTNAYNRLKALVDTGVSAAGATVTSGQKSADTMANAAMAAGNAQAAEYNKYGSAVAGAASSVGGYAAYKGLYGDKTTNNYYGGSPGGDPGAYYAGASSGQFAG